MKFLYEKVYSNQYFALILFATIAVLLVLFGIVLLAAIKDTKKRKLAELDKLEKENINALQEKENNLSSDEEVFGIGQAFTEEAPKKPLEFFASEDEQSKTRDIILSAPTTANSMNNLLSQFEEEKKEEAFANVMDVPLLQNGIPALEHTENIEQDHQDIVPKIEAPIPEVQLVNTSTIENIAYPTNESNVSIENIISKQDEIVEVQEVVPINEHSIEETNTILEDNEDDFELPAIKEEVVNTNIDLNKELDTNIQSISGIDFGKTGILNFSNIESESYEIK